MFIGFKRIYVTKPVTKMNVPLWIAGNPNDYKWPEAESNCRPLVFQTMDNLVTFHNCNLFVVNYRSFVRGFKGVW